MAAFLLPGAGVALGGDKGMEDTEGVGKLDPAGKYEPVAPMGKGDLVPVPETAARVLCADDSGCDDGDPCNGAEVCRPEEPGADRYGCVAGTPYCALPESVDAGMQREGRVGRGCHLAGGQPVCHGLCQSDQDCVDWYNPRFCNGVMRCMASLGLPNYRGALPDGCWQQGLNPCRTGQQCDEVSRSCLDRCGDIPDMDGDGARAIVCGGTDCDDNDRRVHPGATESCDPLNRDEDCDPRTFGARDSDRDGALAAYCCNRGTGGATVCGDDCDDTRELVHPGATELCDGLDNDCDGQVDEGARVLLYADEDGDGTGGGRQEPACPGAAGWVPAGGDCDDGNPAIGRGGMRCFPENPALVEICSRDGWISASCPGAAVCAPQPNGTGVCVPAAGQ